MTEGRVDADLLNKALRCFEAGQGLDDVRRKARERLAARYFMAACGLAPARPAKFSGGHRLGRQADSDRRNAFGPGGDRSA